ncbi:hypothetical protein [Psychrobacter sp. bablab_jr014]|uniref:hypothetical protein n=2 Tax=unclassified Psychrobacter TaxID=196806 RepID=UPI0018F4CBEB|nr:hypothetical protein [Psychrobacter sp. bablab_jr014]
MTKIKNSDETTLLIKLPPDLKASFQGLCKFRGVSVSAELRRFMADEVAKTTTGMTTKPTDATQTPLTPKRIPKQRKSYKNAVQADLELSDTVSSAINAAKKRKNAKNKKR